VANVESNNVSVLLGTGDGRFQSTVHYGAGDRPSSVAIGDLNGDANPDLAVANVESNNVSIFINTSPMCRADFNNDKIVDEMDLKIFSFAIGETDCTWWPDLCICDTDGDDNDIDGADLAVLASEFGRTDCP
jgi:hypothetical protein